MKEGQTNEAIEIYDEVRKAEVPKQKVLEATRGAILARKSGGIELLTEQLRSPDRSFFRLGLSVARELPGREVADTLAGELAKATPDCAALVLAAFADRHDSKVTPAILEVAKTGPKEVRIAAIGVVGRLGDASSLPALLEIATETDAEVAGAAKSAMAGLPGEDINAEIVAHLSAANGKSLPVLIELVGQRRIDAVPALVKALDHARRGRSPAALSPRWEPRSGPKDLPVS